MNAEIIAVGSELLLGQITNTNGRFLSEKMTELGINVYYHTVVGDNPNRLAETVECAGKRSDLVILTGGLGPTKDDLTKETLASVLKTELVHDDETLGRIETFFQKQQKVMTSNNKKQALILKGAEVFQNDYGLACGMAIGDHPRFIMLPGPPKELYPMVENYVVPYLTGQSTERIQISSRVLRFFDIGESKLVDLIDDMIEYQGNPTVAPLASDGEVTLRLTAKGEQKTNEEKLDILEKEILTILGSYFYGYGKETLPVKAAKEIQRKKLTLASAESLTGGLFGEVMTAKPGASSFYTGGVICYDAKVKENLLHIKKDILDTHGTVSEVCAKMLAENVKPLMSADIGISFTGVAGPDSLDDKEPGLVYIGIATSQRTIIRKVMLAGNRSQIREKAAKYGCYYLIKELNEGTTKE
ncbi:competence/damage-inducible protein A [Alteribacter populi]|uniref:competence/damage-inducible protein A n=1 Tax=Alteribacter populi TaxID=2011011 RepID=UPI000BBB4F17|nr:competence/damage-inducible protein A [Alteribacter populi]